MFYVFSEINHSCLLDLVMAAPSIVLGFISKLCF